MWIIFAVLAALAAATAITLSKAGLKDVDPTLGFAIQSVLILLVSWGAVFFQKKSGGMASIDQRSLFFLIGAGIVTCLASLFQFHALKQGQAAMVSSIERSSLVFTIILAVLFLKEEINLRVIIGAVMIIGGAVLIGLSRNDS